MTNKNIKIYLGGYENRQELIKIGYTSQAISSREKQIGKDFKVIAYYTINSDSKPLGLLIEAILRYRLHNLKGYVFKNKWLNNDHFTTEHSTARVLVDFTNIVESSLNLLGITSYKKTIKG